MPDSSPPGFAQDGLRYRLRYQFLCSLPCGLLLMCTQPAAAEGSQIAVSGKILPASCLFEMGERRADFQSISSQVLDLNPTPGRPVKVGRREMDFSIKCASPTRVILYARDNALHATPAGTPRQFTLQHGETKEALGFFEVHLRRDTLTGDGAAIQVIAHQGATWSTPAHDTLSRSEDVGLGFTVDHQIRPKPFNLIAGTFVVDASVTKGREALPTTDAIPISGSLTLQLDYM